MHEAVSVARLSSSGAGATSGRAPVVEPPTLSEQARKKQLREAITKLREADAAQLLELAKVKIAEAYHLGFAAGQAELRKQLPAVVRETSFVSDDKGRIVGKTEREFTPGGKS